MLLNEFLNIFSEDILKYVEGIEYDGDPDSFKLNVAIYDEYDELIQQFNIHLYKDSAYFELIIDQLDESFKTVIIEDNAIDLYHKIKNQWLVYCKEEIGV